MKNTIMPSYEELAIKAYKAKAESLTLLKRKQKVRTITKYKHTGWTFSFWLLLTLNLLFGTFLYLHTHGIL